MSNTELIKRSNVGRIPINTITENSPFYQKIYQRFTGPDMMEIDQAAVITRSVIRPDEPMREDDKPLRPSKHLYRQLLATINSDILQGLDRHKHEVNTNLSIPDMEQDIGTDRYDPNPNLDKLLSTMLDYSRIARDNEEPGKQYMISLYSILYKFSIHELEITIEKFKNIMKVQDEAGIFGEWFMSLISDLHQFMQSELERKKVIDAEIKAEEDDRLELERAGKRIARQQKRTNDTLRNRSSSTSSLYAKPSIFKRLGFGGIKRKSSKRKLKKRSTKRRK